MNDSAGMLNSTFDISHSTMPQAPIALLIWMTHHAPVIEPEIETAGEVGAELQNGEDSKDFASH